MKERIQLLDCTLRDGSYINGSHFGNPAIKGIITKMQDARVDIIECGWLKDAPHEDGSAFFHIPIDIAPYITSRRAKTMYVVMIDWDRYNTDVLPPRDGKSIDAVRVVFPHGKHREGLAVAKKIKDKGYDVLLQAANTLSYSDSELQDMAQCVNELSPYALSIVDTFGAMFFDDLERIARVLDRELLPSIRLGFHSHNNQQLSFALSMHFVDVMRSAARNIVLDASLCGMGRGAGNAPTELVAAYLNRKEHGCYGMDAVMDAIDMYVSSFQKQYTWGYSTPYLIAGMYQCHVNNIAYLQNNHRANAHDMRRVIESLSTEERRHYDYDLLERRYIENQSRIVDDAAVIRQLKEAISGKTVLLIAPGKSIDTDKEKIDAFRAQHDTVAIGVNAINTRYTYDYLFFTSTIRYDYARQSYTEQFNNTHKILLSNIKTQGGEGEIVVGFNRAIKRGWDHFDNAVICALRLLTQLDAHSVALAGFDGFKTHYNESYCDASLPTVDPGVEWDALNDEIKDMFKDFRDSVLGSMDIRFVTDSIYDVSP